MVGDGRIRERGDVEIVDRPAACLGRGAGCREQHLSGDEVAPTRAARPEFRCAVEVGIAGELVDHRANGVERLAGRALGSCGIRTDE
ncbi:MAG: hypothetical protein EBY44_10920, partial [Actinobacteria bacterium]|nr:hypothetical protein [Actinomycetota bacterium]